MLKTYLCVGILWKDRLCTVEDSCILGYGLSLGKGHLYRRYQGMGPSTSGLCKLGLGHTLDLSRIQVYKWVGCRNSPGHRSRLPGHWFRDKCCWGRKGMDCMDLPLWGLNNEHRESSYLSVWVSFNLRCAIRQKLNGSPVYPCRQVQLGIWLITLHSAFWPQVPGQGSMHLFLTHALSRGQSLLRTHSGLQPTYGSPWYSGKHVQIPLLHRVLVPQGDGLQASCLGGAGTVKYYAQFIHLILLLKLYLHGKGFG